MFSVFGFSQEELKKENDSVSKNKLAVVIDFANRYIWRGQSWGGNYAVVQPTIEYKISKKITVGTWATHNFQNKYFYPDQERFYKGYQEIDFYVNYEINNCLSLKVWDYYWPSVEKVEGVDNGFFNYKKNGSKTVDFNANFDFEKVWKPVTFTISTLLAGNDYRYDTNGNTKQNFTTYIEAGYTFEAFKKIEMNSVLGMVINNQAGYYTAGNYEKPSLINFSLKATKEIISYKKYVVPVFVNYVHNASSKNTATFGKNFLLFGMSLKYN